MVEEKVLDEPHCALSLTYNVAVATTAAGCGRIGIPRPSTASCFDTTVFCRIAISALLMSFRTASRSSWKDLYKCVGSPPRWPCMPELKGSIGEGPNQANYSDRSSVRILGIQRKPVRILSKFGIFARNKKKVKNFGEFQHFEVIF